MSENRPHKWPVAWPSKGSTMRPESGGWVLRHKDREPMLFKDDVWTPLDKKDVAA